jgi:hypothetical protein
LLLSSLTTAFKQLLLLSPAATAAAAGLTSITTGFAIQPCFRAAPTTRAALKYSGFSPSVSQRELQELEYRFSKVELLCFIDLHGCIV